MCSVSLIVVILTQLSVSLSLAEDSAGWVSVWPGERRQHQPINIKTRLFTAGAEGELSNWIRPGSEAE